MKTRLFKSIATVLALFCAISLNVAEYIEIDKISTLRAQEEGTKVIYTGEAITTFYGSGGILIQDTTGAIYLKSYDMSKACTAPATAGYPNLKISNIKGIFHKATDMEMTQIEIEYDEDAYNIEVLAENVDFTINDITLADLFANPMAYECQPIRLTETEVKITDYTKSLVYNEEEIIISTGQMGEAMAIPAEGTFIGYYGNNGTQGFIIPESKYITPTAYKSIFELKESHKTSTLGILNPVLVNRVVKNDDGSTTLYVQEDYSFWGTYGTTVIVENLTTDISEGDSIIGIRGDVTPFSVKDGNVYGSKIEQKGNLGANIKVLSRNNELFVTRVQELEYIKGEAALNYESTLCSTPKGLIIKLDDKYAIVVQHSNVKSQRDTVLIAGVDLSEYVGQQHAVVGIVDAGVVNPGKVTFVLRGAHDLLQENYQFNTIAELRKAGRPLAADVTYELVNPVLVTYKSEYNIDDVDLVGVFVQDATGGIFIKKQVNENEKFEINIGDSVKNFKGVYVTTGEAVMLDFTDINNTADDTYEIISSNHAVDATPLNVTIAELAANKDKYASRVVRLENVMHADTTYYPWWSSGYPVTEYYLYQEDCPHFMYYSIWNYALYEKNNIVGIFDDGCLAEGFSLIPLSQAHITDANAEDTPVDNINENTINIAYNNGVLSFSQIIDAIEIYSMDGALVSKQAVNATSIDAMLNSGIYIVRTFADNNIESHKIVIR